MWLCKVINIGRYYSLIRLDILYLINGDINMLSTFKDKIYKARYTKSGNFITLPKTDCKYEHYQCHINPVTEAITYIPIRPRGLNEGDT